MTKKEGQIIAICPSNWLYGTFLSTATGRGLPVVVPMKHSPETPDIFQKDHVDVDNDKGNKYIGKKVMKNPKRH
jgi:hypothetical protein